MMTHRIVIALLLLAVTQRSEAIGALTFDMANYEQMTAVYIEIKKTYEATVGMLNKMDEVSTTIKRAQEGYQAIQNFDLQKAISGAGYRSGGVSNASTLDKSRAMRQELERMSGGVGGNAMYVQRQLQNIGDLERLSLIGDANKKTTEEATKGLNAGKSAAVTAQSTALMATLAAEAAADRKEQQIQRQKDGQREVDDLNSISHVFEALK